MPMAQKTVSKTKKSKSNVPAQTVADRANDGFVSVAKTAGAAMQSVESGTIQGVSAIGRRLFKRKKKNPRKRSKSKDGTLKLKRIERKEPLPVLPKVDARPDAEDKPASPKTERSAPLPVSYSPIKDISKEQKEPIQPKRPQQKIDIDGLIEQYPLSDRVQTIRLRSAIDNLLHSSDLVRLNALKNLVNLGQSTEPFLVAVCRAASSQVVEIALEGLYQIDSSQLHDCIMYIFASQDYELRLVALRAAQRLNDDQARPLLLKGVQDPVVEVRRRTLTYLSWRDSSWAVAAIRDHFNDSEPSVQWAAVEALIAVNPKEAYESVELMMPSLGSVYKRQAGALLQHQMHVLEDTEKKITKERPALSKAPKQKAARGPKKKKQAAKASAVDSKENRAEKTKVETAQQAL